MAKKTPAKGKKPAAKKAVVSVDPKAAFERLGSIEATANLVAGKIKQVEKQESVVANLKAEVDQENESLKELRREQRQLEADLLKIARGGFAERLNFDKPTTSPAATVAKAETSTVDKDAWKSLTLAQMGLTNKRAITALTAAGLDTFGKAEERLGDQFAKPIPNFGEAARQAYDDAKIAYFIKNPQPSETKPAVKQTAQKGDPLNASRGAGVEREKKELGADIDNQLAYFSVPVNEKNALKLLAKVIGTDPVAALEAATLDQLAKWRLSVKGISEGDVKAAVGAMA